MEDSLIVIFSMILAVILMFVFPIMDTWERQDDISYMAIYADVVDFVDSVRNTGKITPNMYNRFMQSIDATGNLYEVTMEHRKRFYKFDAYKNIYTKTIEDVLNSDKDYDDLQAGDYFYVSLKNTNKTQSTLLKEAVYASSQETFKIGVPYGGMVRTTVLEEIETKTTDDDFWSDVPVEVESVDEGFWESIPSADEEETTIDVYVANNMSSSWQKLNSSCFSVNYDDDTKVNTVSVTTSDGWELLYYPLSTVPGKTYTVSIDYEIANDYTVSNYSSNKSPVGIEILALKSIANDDNYANYISSNSVTYLPTNASTGTKTLQFKATGDTTYIALNYGFVTDGTTVEVKYGNISVQMDK